MDARARQWALDHQRVATAIAWLDEHRVDQPRLEDVAAALHLSPGHLQRTFSRYAGTSPARFLRWLTANAARELLRDRAAVLDVAAATGLSSGGRVHDLVVAVDAVTPGQLARRGDGLTLRVGAHPTPVGTVLATTSPRGVVDLRFLDGQAAGDAIAEVASVWSGARIVEDARATAPVADHLVAVLTGAPVSRPLHLALHGTNLQLAVWSALLTIPDDAVVSYGEVARATGHPTAVRAVGTAIGRNPVAALVPCHRVLRATGEVGGYRWGVARKRALLAREAARVEEGARASA